MGLAIVAAALVAIALVSLGGGSSSSSAASKRTATVGKGVVQSTVSGNGTLEPAQQVELSFGASGEVTAIDVKAGQKVKKGQVLAEIDSSSARASLASAEAALIEAEEAVATAEESEEESEEVAYTGGAETVFADLTTSTAVAGASEGAVPVEGAAEGTTEGAAPEGDTSSEALKRTREELKKAKEEARLARKEAKEAARKSGTAASGAEGGSPAVGGDASGTTSGSSSADEPSASTEAAGGESSAPAGESAATTETAAPAAEASSTESGASAGGTAGGVSLPTAEANLREAELSVKSARQEVRETTLRAPISGTIAQISGAVGESVSGGSASGGGTSEASAAGATGGGSSSSAFIVLAQVHRLKMEVSFSESDIGKVRKGQTATVSIDSMEGTELAGEVTKVSVLPSEGSTGVVEYPATILLTQNAKGVRTGMSASAEVIVEQVKNAVTVASEALSGKSVTVEESGEEVTKSVKTGLEGDETTQIISGLKAGETVVLPEATVATSTSGASEKGSEESAVGGFPGGFGGTGGPPSGGGFPSGGP